MFIVPSLGNGVALEHIACTRTGLLELLMLFMLGFVEEELLLGHDFLMVMGCVVMTRLLLMLLLMEEGTIGWHCLDHLLLTARSAYYSLWAHHL